MAGRQSFRGNVMTHGIGILLQVYVYHGGHVLLQKCPLGKTFAGGLQGFLGIPGLVRPQLGINQVPVTLLKARVDGHHSCKMQQCLLMFALIRKQKTHQPVGLGVGKINL